MNQIYHILLLIVFQLNICLSIRAEYYKLNKNVFLVIEYNKNKLYNIYFINNSNSIDSIINTIL